MVDLIAYILIVMGVSAHFFYWPLMNTDFEKKHSAIFSLLRINWIYPVIIGSILLALF